MALNKDIPHDKSLDNSLDLMQEGYMFIKNRVDRFQSVLFEARFFGQRVICMSGEEAAKVFYDPEKFQRRGSIPKRIQKSFIGVDSIQSMDGQTHLDRKQLFMSFMTPSHDLQLGDMVKEQWQVSIRQWEQKQSIILFEESRELLCRVACDWAGVPLKESEVKERAEDFISMVDSFGAIGPRHWKGRRARQRSEDWLRNMIAEVRSGQLKVKEDSILYESVQKGGQKEQRSSRKRSLEHRSVCFVYVRSGETS